jgi:hypothetical protein
MLCNIKVSELGATGFFSFDVTDSPGLSVICRRNGCSIELFLIVRL